MKKTHPNTDIAELVHGFLKERERGIEERPIRASSDPFWKSLKETGSDLWFDTGDIEAAGQVWSSEFSALTTNNTLLNAEVQKGIYDDFIGEASRMLFSLPIDERVLEIAFILNAYHGLRLVKRFGGRVSVELHTALSDDIDGTIRYARRFHRISPDYFIVKVPLTPSGYIATRTLRKENVPVNFTLGFSARHNYIAASFSVPSFVNVFLGRLNSYVSDNGLGDGRMVGEKATISSQQVVRELSKKSTTGTRQIAASLREDSQVQDLAGVDVLTIPVQVARSARKELSGQFESRVLREYQVRLSQDIDEKAVGIQRLWEVTDKEKKFVERISSEVPKSAGEFIAQAHEAGLTDLFPRFSPEELKAIAGDGKIPKHKRWEDRVKRHESAVDSLINLAGLASFAESQRELDDRVRKLIS